MFIENVPSQLVIFFYGPDHEGWYLFMEHSPLTEQMPNSSISIVASCALTYGKGKPI